MKNVKAIVRMFFLAFSVASCSDKKPETNKVQKMAKEAGDKVGELGKDIRQEACEVVDGKLDCAVERAKRELEDAVD